MGGRRNNGLDRMPSCQGRGCRARPHCLTLSGRRPSRPWGCWARYCVGLRPPNAAPRGGEDPRGPSTPRLHTGRGGGPCGLTRFLRCKTQALSCAPGTAASCPARPLPTRSRSARCLPWGGRVAGLRAQPVLGRGTRPGPAGQGRILPRGFTAVTISGPGGSRTVLGALTEHRVRPSTQI